MDKKKIRQIREKKNWDLKRFAFVLGVSVRTVQGWENGRKPNASARAMLKEMAR